MGLELVEEAAEVSIGRSYLVNVVKTMPYQGPWLGQEVPVLGTLHEDQELTGFRWKHWHVDWRFVTHGLMDHVITRCKRRPDDGFLGIPVYFPNRPLPDPRRVELECKREHAMFPSNVEWMATMEFAHRERRSDCKTCPHRGISLVGAPVDGRGARVCPGHGLAWDRETGELMPRVWKA